MIRNWQEHELFMDFSGMRRGNAQPSDIDLFWLGRHCLVLGEIKNERGELKDGQRALLEKLADGWKYDAMVLFITHDRYVQNGDKLVDVAKCYVREYYFKGRWHKPKSPTTVKQIIEWA